MKRASDTTRNLAAGQSWWSVLGWGAYLACSWTWCIGMFLPVLLVRDYGIWGFVVFAVPNVVGAGAMGWVVSRSGARELALKHRAAVGAFSYVTAVFQLVFSFWLIQMGHVENEPPHATSVSSWKILAFLGGLYVVSWALARVRSSLALPAVIWLFSFGIGAYLVGTGQLDFSAAIENASRHARSNGVWFLAPVCIFGFLLCPYLDATFLTAASNQERRDARASFSVGFGMLFFAMILLTFLYAPLFVAQTEGTAQMWPVPLAKNLITLHILVQLAYTVYLHVWGVIGASGGRSVLPRVALLVAAVGLAALAWSGMMGGLPSHAGMSGGEVVYRCFMSFYGLVFPAYVWLCMIPTGDGHSGIEEARGRWKLGVLVGACVLAAPCYWMGFIERVEWWLAVGLGVVLVARGLVRSGFAASPASAGEVSERP